MAASLPSAARVAGTQYSFATGWLAVAGLIALPYVLAMAAARLARRSWQQLVPSSQWGAVTVAVWALLSLPLDWVLGARLMAATHQRALGGATWAVLALVCNLAALLVAGRARQVVSSLPPAIARATSGLLVALALAAFLIAASRVGALATGVTIVAAITAAASPGVSPKRARTVSLAAGAGVLGLVCLAVTLLVRSPSLARAASEHAPFVRALGQALFLRS
jgi:hypothetical protein